MSNLTVKDVCIAVRSFLDEIKKTQFFFDIISVDLIDGEWEVECEVSNHPDDDGVEYLIRMDDATGEITHISITEDEPDDEGGEDDDEGGENGGRGAGVDDGVSRPSPARSGDRAPTGGW